MNDGGPAFPRSPFTPGELHDQLGQAGFVATGHPGMTLRDWFAGQAIIGLLGNSGGIRACKHEFLKVLGDTAFCVADAMLQSREGGPR